MSDLMNAPFSDAWFHRLKAAQRDLIKHCGGIERCAELTSVSKSQIGRWNNAVDPDLMSLPAVLRLEAECSLPLVTSVMAGINGRRLADPDETPAGASANIMATHAESVLRFAELATVAAKAFADGKLSTAEASEMDRAASRLDRIIADLRSGLARAKAAQGLDIIDGGRGGAA